MDGSAAAGGWPGPGGPEGPSRPPRPGKAEPLPPSLLPPSRSVELPRGKVVVVVNDAQRPTPTPWLLERLRVDWDRDDLLFAVATGSHAPPGEEELRAVFGPFLERVRGRLVLHRPDGEGMIDAGTTTRGTPVLLNRCLEGAAAVVCLGSVEPHYFAGWTGGRKSIVPGLCALETMRANHRLALEGGAPGRPEDSPVHLDLEEALELAQERLGGSGRCALLGLNAVAVGDDIYGWHHGSLAGAVRALAGTAARVYGRIADRTWPLVVCFVPRPLDRDLYQALKAFENWKSVVAEGGRLVLVAACGRGLGPPTFRQFLGSPPTLAVLLDRVRRDYRLGDHKLVNLLRYLESGRSLVVVSGGPLPREGLAVQVEPSLDRALGEAAAEGRGGPGEALCVDDAAHCYPLAGPGLEG